MYALDGAEYQISTTPDPLHAYGVMSTPELIVTIIDTQGTECTDWRSKCIHQRHTPVADNLFIIVELAPFSYVDTSGNDKLFLAFLGLDGILPKMGSSLTR